jgi:hypothetical protein
VALLLIGILSAKTLSDTDARIKSICAARCPSPYFTAEKLASLERVTFGEAVTQFFRGKVSDVMAISVRPWRGAEIVRWKGRPRILEYTTGRTDDVSVVKDTRQIDAVDLDRIRYALQDRLLGSAGNE